MSDVLIPDGWTPVKLGDVCEKIDYGYTASACTDSVGPRFLRITDIQLGYVSWDSVPYCVIGVSDHSKYKLINGDIVIARTGNSTGENYIFESNEDCVFASYLIRFRVSHTTVNAKFVWYTLRSHSWWSFVSQSKSGSAQSGANAKVLSGYLLLLPPLHEQKAIAHILGSLDDKIDQLRKTNSVLEDIASALFKSWFVDFDPVKAKQENIPTGLPPELDALFPDSFEESSLGPIPTGWRVGSVGDVCKLSKDSVNPGKHPDEVFAHYSLPAFDEGQEPKLEIGSIIKSNKYLVPSDAVLLSKLNPHIPRIWMPDVAINNRPIASTEYLVLSPKAGYSRGYVFGLVTSSAFTSIYGTMVSGTTGSHQRVTPSHVLEVSLVLPPDEVLNEYADLVMDLYSKKHSNTHQIRTLTNLRDTLLPKLISGELRVPEAEQMVSDLGL